MEKIGDFAKRCQTTIKTLRFYDQLGLLAPDYVDTFTGYRYYGPDRAAEMRRITELKETGLSLEEIKGYYHAITTEERNRIIEEKQWSLTKLAEDTARQLKKLESIKRNLQKGDDKMIVDINAPFENDERVIGRWQFIATVDNKECFTPGNEHKNETAYEELYFLPNGEEYWGFTWTKGYVKITFGDGIVVPYELRDFDGETFMFVDNPHSGGVWVLKQADKIRYTKHEIGKCDNIGLPFVNDARVIGKWVAVDFVKEIDDFDPLQKSYDGVLVFQLAEFFPSGELHWDTGHLLKAKWTKGTALITTGDGTFAPAYEIRTINGKEYLFIQWKNGDYVWGKRNPCYYVFSRKGVN